MTNLKPELRADYTGKLVTRYVKADFAPQTSSSIPSPGKPAEQAHADLDGIKKRLIDVLASASAERSTDFDEPDDEDADEYDWKDNDDDPGFDPSELIDPDHIGTALAELPDKTINHIKAMLDDNPYYEDYSVVLLHALTYHRSDAQFIEYLTYKHSDVNELYAGDDMSERDDVNAYTVLSGYVDGLRAFNHLGYVLPDSPYEATEEEWALIDALYRLRTATADENGRVEDGLAQIIIERPEAIQRVLDIVENRSSKDAELIVSILNSPAPALSEGTL